MQTEIEREDVSAADYRFAIVVSRWNGRLTGQLASGAERGFRERGAAAGSIETFRVPGSFELPLACLKAAEMRKFDAIVALGVIIRGDTPHFDHIAAETAAGVMRASMDSGVPVLFGVITADTLEQAEARAADNDNNKGFEAAISAIEMADLMRKMRGLSRDASGAV